MGVRDPDEVNPLIVETVVGHGGRVRYVTRTPHALEETYLKLVREGESG